MSTMCLYLPLYIVLYSHPIVLIGKIGLYQFPDAGFIPLSVMFLVQILSSSRKCGLDFNSYNSYTMSYSQHCLLSRLALHLHTHLILHTTVILPCFNDLNLTSGLCSHPIPFSIVFAGPTI